MSQSNDLYDIFILKKFELPRGNTLAVFKTKCELKVRKISLDLVKE